MMSACMHLLPAQLSGVTERRRQLEVQLTESATANNKLSAQVRAVCAPLLPPPAGNCIQQDSLCVTMSGALSTTDVFALLTVAERGCILCVGVLPLAWPCRARGVQVSTLQSSLGRSQAAEANLTARLDELSGQLADSSVEGGSLRAQNGELLAELAALRWVRAL
jgi:hypothetical protein